MAGIYLHIPFCKQACHYCNFHFSTSMQQKGGFVKALLQEIELRKEYTGGDAVETIYFGGGTPSLLTDNELGSIMEALHRQFTLNADAEITLEANPDDIDPAKLETWKRMGINRLSIGVQSFLDTELQWMNRAHQAGQARQCIEDSLRAGFRNMSIDLIYGSPLLSNEDWEKNVAIATGYGIPHLSCYALTVEEKTALHHHIQTSKKQPVDEERQAEQFMLLMDWLRRDGYEHYEVSNFAKPGMRSRHNSAYWKGVPYLGLGPSAHSYNGKERSWNLANNALYIQGLETNSLRRETEELTDANRFNETLMISLRTKEGIDLDALQSIWGLEERRRIEKKASPLMHHGLLTQTDNRIQLTDAGMLQADGIAAGMFR